MKPLFVSLVIVFAAAASFIACKQGEDDRCQVDDDCIKGVCSKSTGKCTTGGSNNAPNDALPPDGKIFEDAKVFMDAGSGSGSGSAN